MFLKCTAEGIGMRILYLAPEISIPGSHGGAAHVMGTLASSTRLGHQVVAVVKKGHGQRFVEKGKHLSILRMPTWDVVGIKQICYFLNSLLVCFFLLFGRKIDLVYERGRIFGGVGVMMAYLFRVKSVYEMNEPYPDLPVMLGTHAPDSFLAWIIRRWHQAAVKRATLVTVTHASLIEHGLAPQENSKVIVHGADVNAFASASGKRIRKDYHLEGKFIVLYTGSFAPWHACEQLIRAVARVVENNKDILFLMVGKGGQYEHCKALVRALGVEKQVLFPGEVLFHDIPSYVAAADVCVALFDRSYPPFQKYSFFFC